MKQIYLAFLLTLILPLGLSAQSKFEMGVQSGFGRFAPKVVRLYSTGYNNNSMENGWGWSAGAFGRYNFREWLKPQVEVNLYNGQSHLTFEHVNYSDVTEEPVGASIPILGFGRQLFRSELKCISKNLSLCFLPLSLHIRMGPISRPIPMIGTGIWDSGFLPGMPT
jgi:hypothetical protein